MVFNICHFSLMLSSALTLAEGFSFFSFSLSFRICFFSPRSNTFSPRIMSKLKPSGALFSCEPGKCQDLYPPSPSSSPRQRRCLANPSDGPQKSPPSPNKATRRVCMCAAARAMGTGSTLGVPVSPTKPTGTRRPPRLSSAGPYHKFPTHF